MDLFVNARANDAPNEETDHNHGEHEKYLTMANDKECTFYQIFSHKLLNSVPIPIYFYGDAYDKIQQTGVIVLEDLSKTSRMVNLVDGLNIEQVCRRFVIKIIIVCIRLRQLLKNLPIYMHIRSVLIVGKISLHIQTKTNISMVI
jgi:hypothetical protein